MLEETQTQLEEDQSIDCHCLLIDDDGGINKGDEDALPSDVVTDLG